MDCLSKKMCKIFTISWSTIQRALDFENRMRYLKVTVNCSFLVHMRKIRKQSATPIFYKIFVLCYIFYNLLMFLLPTSPCFWKLDQVLESFCQFSIFDPNAPSKGIESHAHFFGNFYFVYLQPSYNYVSNEPLVVTMRSGIHKLKNF